MRILKLIAAIMWQHLISPENKIQLTFDYENLSFKTYLQLTFYNYI